MANKKISQFNETLSANTESFISIIENGTNYKITKENYLKNDNNDSLIGDAPNDGKKYIRQYNQWIEFTPDSGSTINKIYTASITQSGTDQPTISIINDTLGGDTIITREAIGAFKIINTENNFSAENLAILFGPLDISAFSNRIIMNGIVSDAIYFITVDSDDNYIDGSLKNTTIKIEINN